jgi:hypothetical protein
MKHFKIECYLYTFQNIGLHKLRKKKKKANCGEKKNGTRKQKADNSDKMVFYYLVMYAATALFS